MLIIGITGTNGASKGTVVDYLTSNLGFKHYSVSGYLNEEIVKEGKTPNRDNQREIANRIRKEKGPDYIIKTLFEKASKQDHDSIIESIRNPKEVEFLKSLGGKILAVSAEQKLRYERIKLRGSEKDNVTFEEFQKQEEMETSSQDPYSQNLFKCMEMANIVITNNESLEKLHEQIKIKIDQIK